MRRPTEEELFDTATYGFMGVFDYSYDLGEHRKAVLVGSPFQEAEPGFYCPGSQAGGFYEGADSESLLLDALELLEARK